MKKTNIIKLASSSRLFLDKIPLPMQVLSGEINLFLIHLEQGKTTDNYFIMTLRSGDKFPQIDKITHLSNEYAFAICAEGEAIIEETDDFDANTWRLKCEELFLNSYSRRLNDNDNFYLEFVIQYQKDIQKRQHLLKENRSITTAALTSKIAALGEIASIELTSKGQQDAINDSLFISLHEISKIYRLPLDKDKEILFNKELSIVERIELFCQTSGWRVRKIAIDKDIYRQSAMPHLAITKSTNEPLVIYPSGNTSSYFDTSDSKKKPLTKRIADDLEEHGYCFYESFPNGKLNKRKLLNFILSNTKHILFMTIVIGIISSILSLVSPVATAYITGKIIPTANIPELWQIAILLTVLLVCQILLGVVPTLIMMLFSSWQFERLQAAVYDRILRIPVHKLKICDAGDMTQRVLGVTQIQAAIFGVISQQFLLSLFAIFSLAMMFYYSKELALIGVVMVIIYAIILFLLSQINLKPLTAHAAARGRVSGLMKQFFDGIGKIRSAGAEQQVICRFMDDFSIMSQEEYKTSSWGAYQGIFTTIFPTLISLIFYGMAGGFMETNLSFPIFLAFMAAFQNFQNGVMSLTSGIWTLLAIKPEIDRIMPILEVETEDETDKYLPSQLDGNISLSKVSYRYNADGPLILDNVSIQAKSGEFIAVAGASGAGKSTLIRLLLGFEKLESGAIYYSGQDLANLNLRAVRRQLGVILQNSKVMNGSILDNIITGTKYTKNDAKKALKLAAFDEDVENLPMKIHTMISPSNISGGQQQRILIARTLVGNPVAVIMDESTSALDNMTQDIVKKNMEQLKMTRIIIAHRLSTIINADRIYVMDKGKVVECGTYSELIKLGGIFKELANRQQLNMEKQEV